ncbi:hypothetical protein RJ40_10455 [Methanofollis aquaemaris]|uniref:Uncharacterized protein n=1 Tax=Methanofollis aquaemaris TaxID=126734 RepID=A0A8A3S864_9EURY|nr:hypothetical protein [Methanofollis aquaemaris]QSZ67884.1 hypothetical protein RJ40_10455 [Methanofollis aquaemaris]
MIITPSHIFTPGAEPPNPRDEDGGGKAESPNILRAVFFLRISGMREICVFKFSSITPELNVWIIFMVNPQFLFSWP